METRTRKLSITKVGGNASENSKRVQLGLPTAWINAMGLDSENRDVKMTFKDNKIIIEKLEENELD